MIKPRKPYPAYLELWQSGELARRVELGLTNLADYFNNPTIRAVALERGSAEIRRVRPRRVLSLFTKKVCRASLTGKSAFVELFWGTFLLRGRVAHSWASLSERNAPPPE